MSEAAVAFFREETVFQEPIPGHAHKQTRFVKETIRCLKSHDDSHDTGTSRKSTGMPGTRSGCLQRHRRCPGILTTTTRFGKITRSGWQILHTRIRVTSHSNKLNLWMRPSATSHGCTTQRSTSFVGHTRTLNSKNRKALVFLPRTYVYYWRKDKRETKGSFKGIARVLHRNQERQ